MGLAFLGFRVQIETLCLFANEQRAKPCAVRRSIKLVYWIFGCGQARGYILNLSALPSMQMGV